MAANPTKYITSKYGTKIEVTGLRSDQIKEVQKLLNASKGNANKAVALAKTVRAQNLTEARARKKEALIASGGIDPRTGAIDPATALAQAPKVPGATDLQGDVDKAREAAYGYITKDYETQKARELENAKQELANRGIPLDVGEQSLYGRTIGDINNRYQGLYDQAKNQSISAGNDILSTETGVAKTANDAFLAGLGLISDADLTKYGIDKDTATKLASIANDKAIAQKQIDAQKSIEQKKIDAQKAAETQTTFAGSA